MTHERKGSSMSPAAHRIMGVSVDALAKSLCVKAFDFVKLDIEGAELSVLGQHHAGAPLLRWLLRTRYVYLETHDDMTSGAEAHSLGTLLRHNFSVVAGFRPNNRVERVYIACGRQVRSEACLETCRQWRKNSFGERAVSWCRAVTIQLVEQLVIPP